MRFCLKNMKTSLRSTLIQSCTDLNLEALRTENYCVDPIAAPLGTFFVNFQPTLVYILYILKLCIPCRNI